MRPLWVYLSFPSATIVSGFHDDRHLIATKVMRTCIVVSNKKKKTAPCLRKYHHSHTKSKLSGSFAEVSSLVCNLPHFSRLISVHRFEQALVFVIMVHATLHIIVLEQYFNQDYR